MRDFKSIGFNLTIPLLYVVFFFKFTENLSDFSFILEHLYLTIIISIFLLSFSFNTVNVNQLGISKSYLGTLKYKQKTWRDIKFYAEVDEVYTGQHAQTIKALWFIDINDKVCLRVQTKYRKNLNEVLRIIDKFEDKYEHKLTQKNPHFMKKGWTKVKYNVA
ncbi:MAG: hypothetical protein ACJ0P6_04645 [Flavobacteriaceae bacterium]|tara:strand:- start:2661 stop:3146 length:486 start_codon:yes stop_codon:yes gene_type:complete